MLRYAMLAFLVLMGSRLQAQVTSDLSDGLIAYWSFDDGSASDSSGNGFHGMIVGNLESVVGVQGQAFRFPGGSFISVEGDELGATSSTERSISLWARPESLPGDGGGLISKYHHFIVPQSNFYARLSASDNQVLTRLTGEGTNVIDVIAGEFGIWQHFVFILKDGPGNSRIYRNGSLIASGDLNYNSVVSSEPLRIGTVVGAGDQTFIGDLDEIRIYDHVLTESEIRFLSRCSLPANQPVIFSRQTGPPTTQQFRWHSCGGSAMLVVGSESAPPSYVYLNGVTVVTPADFRPGASISAPVELSVGENVLEVYLLGKPGNRLSVELLVAE